VVVDVVIGSAFACGGFSVAMLVYIFNRGEYHPLVRPALLASLFGYTLAGVGVIFDLGRWWNVWHMFWPWFLQSQFGDVRGGALHLALHHRHVDRVLAGLLEKWGNAEAGRKKLGKVMFFFIALGTVLPMMHQSSLGTLLVVMGVQIHPLWQTPMQPLLYLLSAITMGYAVVLFESCLPPRPTGARSKPIMLTPMAKIMLGLLAVYLAGARRRPGGARRAGPRPSCLGRGAVFFWIEMLSFIAFPLFLIGAESPPQSGAAVPGRRAADAGRHRCCASTAS
jgi:Ni/Fe-hydrogenase subunit HybB-like protein